MLTGSPSRAILLFAVPLFIGNVFQQLYNMVDAMVVGRFVGINALAAVGASGPAYSLMISLVLGAASGASVVTAQIFGSGDSQGLRRAYITMWKILGILGLAFSVIGFLLAGPTLRLLGTPAEVYAGSLMYVRIMCCGILATCLYNGMSSFLRSVGNSSTPLVALIISSIVNIVLDLAFVLIGRMGVAGVAAATVIAQLVSGLYCLAYVHRKMPDLGFSVSEFRIDPPAAREMVRIGLPATFSTVVVTLSTMFIQAAVNSYGAIVVGAYTVGNKVENICFCLAFSIGLATGVFCGQNIGAGDEKRTVEGLYAGLRIAVIYSAVMAVFGFVFAAPLVRFFSPEPEVLTIGVPLIRLTGCFGPVLGMVFVFQNFLRNVSDVRPTVVMSFAEIISRGILPFVLSSWIGYFGIWWATPVGWTLSALIGFIRYKSGKWKGKAAAVQGQSSDPAMPANTEQIR